MTHARARLSDPQTSQDAAESVPVTPLEAVCLQAIRKAPMGLTSEELAEETGLSLVTVSPRLRPLANEGRVYAGGKRKNRSGHLAIVWVASTTQPSLF